MPLSKSNPVPCVTTVVIYAGDFAERERHWVNFNLAAAYVVELGLPDTIHEIRIFKSTCDPKQLEPVA